MAAFDALNETFKKLSDQDEGNYNSIKEDQTVKEIYSSMLTGMNIGAISSAISDLIFNSDDVVEDLEARGIYDKRSLRWDSKFSRIGIADPYNATTNTYEYVFFTKPDLHLMNGSVANDELTNHSSFFSDAISRYPHIVDQLQFSYSMNRNGGTLSPLLTNAMNGNLDLPSISADTIETPQNVFGVKMDYRGSSYKSDEDFDFTIEFKDTKYLEVYMWLKMYDEYERLKWRGHVTPPSDSYVVNKILHDQIAIYKFIVGDDGMSLLYWARILGAFPVSVPRDTFGNKVEGELTYSTNWHGQFVSDMDPAILVDFNNITAPYRGSMTYLPLYDSKNHRFNPTWAKSPVIATRKNVSTTDDKLNKYYLLWTV